MDANRNIKREAKQSYVAPIAGSFYHLGKEDLKA